MHLSQKTLRRRAPLAVLALSVLFSMLCVSASAAEAKKKAFDIPAGDAIVALKRFTSQSGEQLLYAAATVESVRTQAVRGNFTPREAINQMIAGTELKVVEDRTNGSFSLVRNADPNGRRAAQATQSDRPVNPRRNSDDAVTGAQEKAGRAVATKSDSSGADREETIQLSPFEVVANTRGYYGANTTSGTRLNSKLEDLGASITVVTKQQMEDLALLDMNDIFNYEASTEGTGNYTDFSFDRNGAPVDNTEFNPLGANRIRGIGPANITYGSFETSGRTPIDPIDIDAVEISRGPNSNIFGIGRAAGTVNTVRSAANLHQDRTRVSVRVDSFEGFRGSIDFNRVLKKDVLAVRASAVYQHTGYDLKPSGTYTTRLNGMAKYQPFKSTTITASHGYYRLHGNRPNTSPPRDGIDGWLASGSPTWNPVTATATVNGVPGLPLPSTVRNAQHSYSIISIDPNGFNYWTPYRTTVTNSPVGQNGGRILKRADRTDFLNNQPLIQDYPPVTSRAIYDWSEVNLAAANRISDRSEITTVLVDHVFLSSGRQSLAAQLGWFRENSEQYTRNLVGASASVGVIGVLQVDINERRLDGTPNPNFLRPFMSSAVPRTILRPEDRDTYRGQVAYQLNLTKEKNLLRWLGTHKVSGYAEYKDIKSWLRNYRDTMLGTYAWLGDGQSRAADGAFGGLPAGPIFARSQFQFYVGDDQGQNVDYGTTGFDHGVYPLTWGNEATGVFVTEPVQIGPAIGPAGGNANSWSILKTQGAILQSHLLRDRVVTTFGYRNDELNTRLGGTPILLPDGTTIDEASFHSWAPGDWTVGKGKTRTAGVVVKPFRWLSLYVNKSDSFQVAAPRVDLYRQPLPNPTGKGEDYGFMLNLFDGKLFIRANVYTTKQLDSRRGQIPVLGTRMLTLDRPDIPGQNAAPPPFQLQAKATEWVLAAAAAQNQTLSADQINTRVAEIMGVPVDFITEAFTPTATTSDVTAKGKELEINFNPTQHWTMKLNVTEQESINENIGPDVVSWAKERLAVWEKIIDPLTGRPWFTERYNDQQSASQRYIVGVAAPLALEVATEGLSRPQIRRYRANFVTSFRLAGITDHQVLKRVKVGGGLRWEDKGAIGFYGRQQLPDVITEYDPQRPIYDKAHFYADVFLGYRTRLFHDKVGATFQLNVRNIAESGRLQPVAANPDGTIAGYRIISPRQFILSATVDL